MTKNNHLSAQDQALDQLLDMAPAVPASPILTAQILAAATANNAPPKVIEFQSKPQKSSAFKSGNWLIGGLMAASLIIGIWSGTNDISNILVTAPLELAGIEQNSEFDIYPVLDGLSATESLL